MAPSSGHLLVPKVLKVVRFAVAKTNQFVRSRLPTTNASAKAAAEPIPVYARNHPTHPLAYLKQARSQNQRFFGTQARTFVSSATKNGSTAKFSRSKLPVSRISTTIQQSGLSPFATTLRPNLTGGTLPRAAGGYSLGGIGRARHFSHTSGCQAQVINNVNAGIRAFVVGGGKVRYDGIDPLTGEKRFTRTIATQEKVYSHLRRSTGSIRGTALEFRISPTVTALSPAFSKYEQGSSPTLQTSELLSTLSGDFARALKSLSQILGDLDRLSALGDLPISLMESPDGPVLSVRFSGCDADLVSRLCDEVGVTRGILKEDEAWHEDKEVQMALLFPFAPTKSNASDSEMDASDYFYRNNLAEAEAKQEQLRWRDDLSCSDRSLDSKSDDHSSLGDVTPRSHAWQFHSPSGYESLEESDSWTPSPHSDFKSHNVASSGVQEYDGVEGIYRFLQVCDESRLRA